MSRHVVSPQVCGGEQFASGANALVDTSGAKRKVTRPCEILRGFYEQAIAVRDARVSELLTRQSMTFLAALPHPIGG